MKKTITITVIVTILVALTGAIIWLFPGADNTVRGRDKRDSLCEVTREVETITTTTTTTTDVSGQYVMTVNGLVRVD